MTYVRGEMKWYNEKNHQEHYSQIITQHPLFGTQLHMFGEAELKTVKPRMEISFHFLLLLA